MNKKVMIWQIVLLGMIISCSKPDNTNDFYLPEGVFIICEGNYNRNNADIAFYYPETHAIENDIFLSANGFPLGEVAQSATIIDHKLFVVVNNSGLIRVIDPVTMKSEKTFHGFRLPRFILPLNHELAFVSDLSTRFLWIINYHEGTIIDSIPVGKSTETMLLRGNHLYAANWSKLGMPDIINNTVMVIDITTLTITDTIITGTEPNSMVTDKYGYLWILCSGGFNGSEMPSLYKIDAITNIVACKWNFPSRDYLPSHLVINKQLDTLYYICNHIYALPVDNPELPGLTVIRSYGQNFYSLGISGHNELFVSDAIDYMQAGMVYRYTTNGTAIDSFRTGIIPGWFTFTQ